MPLSIVLLCNQPSINAGSSCTRGRRWPEARGMRGLLASTVKFWLDRPQFSGGCWPGVQHARLHRPSDGLGLPGESKWRQARRFPNASPHWWASQLLCKGIWRTRHWHSDSPHGVRWLRQQARILLKRQPTLRQLVRVLHLLARSLRHSHFAGARADAQEALRLHYSVQHQKTLRPRWTLRVLQPRSGHHQLHAYLQKQCHKGLQMQAIAVCPCGTCRVIQRSVRRGRRQCRLLEQAVLLSHRQMHSTGDWPQLWQP